MTTPSQRRRRVLLGRLSLALAVLLILGACQAPADGAPAAPGASPQADPPGAASPAAPSGGGYDYGY